MTIKRDGSAVWSGGIKDGKGQVSTGSGALKDQPYGFNTRFENEPGTNPEELIAAAHAGWRGLAGGVLEAAVAAYSFYRLIDPKVASSGGWIFSDKVKDKSNFIALNDSTFQIKLVRPFPPFMSLLTTQYCSVVPKEVVEHYGKDFRSHPVGTGPFKFKYWKEGDIESKIRIQNLVFPEGLSIRAENREYLTGRVNSIFGLVPTFTGIDRGNKKQKTHQKFDGSFSVAGTGLEPVTFGL